MLPINLNPIALKRLLDAANDARVLAEDRLIAVQNERDRWYEQFTRKDKELSDALKTIANVEWQRQYGIKLYPEAPGIPEGRSVEQKPGPIERPMSQTAMIRKKETLNFISQAKDQWKTVHGEAG